MIHAYKLNGYNIILDQNSGCVHSVDPVAYDMITMYQDHDKEEIRRFILEKYKDQPDVTNADIDLCFEDIEALIADGRLFAEDTFEAVADQFKRRQGILKAICLHVAHDCNLACKYCLPARESTTASVKSCPMKWASRHWIISLPTVPAAGIWKWTSLAVSRC